MIEEWNKWRAEPAGEYDWGWEEADWVGDWGQPGQAWDRYAILDGQVSKAELGSKADTEVETHEQEEHNTASKKKSKKTAAPTGDKNLELNNKKAKSSKQEEEPSKKRKVEPETPDSNAGKVPTDEKGQVNAIAKYLKEVKAAGWKVTKHEDLTDDIKKDFKKPFPPTEECRLNIYWKRPSTGVHLKGENKDICTYAVDPHCGPYLLRLHSSLKAAALLVTRKNWDDNMTKRTGHKKNKQLHCRLHEQETLLSQHPHEF